MSPLQCMVHSALQCSRTHGRNQGQRPPGYRRNQGQRPPAYMVDGRCSAWRTALRGVAEARGLKLGPEAASLWKRLQGAELEPDWHVSATVGSRSARESDESGVAASAFDADFPACALVLAAGVCWIYCAGHHGVVADGEAGRAKAR